MGIHGLTAIAVDLRSLYYAAWTSSTLSKWDGRTTTVLNSLAGCSHNGLALTRQRTFLLACTDERATPAVKPRR
jgi:hypothetical protein